MATKSYLDLGGLSKFWEKAKVYIDNNIEQNKYDDTELAAEVAQNTAAISILNGDGEGSVKKSAADAVAEIVTGADEKYDTLKEISDFIINDVTGSAGLVNKVTANSNAIQELETTTSILVSNGDGSKYLADDGSYKAVTADYASKADADGNGKNIADTYATKEEVPTKVSQLENDADYLPNTIQIEIENGVYVVDINGDLHDPNTFTGTADDVTGIGLVTNNGSWIVALDEWYSISESTAWNGNTYSAWGGYNKTVTGCWTGTSGYLNDFDGEANTDAIIAQLKGTNDGQSGYTGAPAAEYCRAYSKGYKDVGSWYLPAAGELNEIVLNKDAINAILTKLGKNSLSKNDSTWSSSQYNSSFAWTYLWSYSYWDINSKNYNYGVRPICKLEAFTTITSRIESLETTTAELNVKATPTDTELEDVIEYVTATEMEAALARIAELENYVNGLKENIAESIQLANRIIG